VDLHTTNYLFIARSKIKNVRIIPNVFCFAGRKMEIQLEEVENQYASLGECFS
jgi:hypothetical protein